MSKTGSCLVYLAGAMAGIIGGAFIIPIRWLSNLVEHLLVNFFMWLLNKLSIKSAKVKNIAEKAVKPVSFVLSLGVCFLGGCVIGKIIFSVGYNFIVPAYMYNYPI